MSSSKSLRKNLFQQDARADKELDVLELLSNLKITSKKTTKNAKIKEKEMLEDLLTELRKKEKEILEDNWKYEKVVLPIM